MKEICLEGKCKSRVISGTIIDHSKSDFFKKLDNLPASDFGEFADKMIADLKAAGLQIQVKHERS